MTIFQLVDVPVPVPLFGPLVAVSASSVLTLSYVGGLYVSTATRIGRAKSKEGVLLTKDDAVIVKSRLRIASITTLLCLTATCDSIRRLAYAQQAPLFGFLGALRLAGIPLPVPSLLHNNIFPFQPSLTLYTMHHVLPSILLPLSLTATLFSGPLLVAGLDGSFNTSLRSALSEKLGNIWGIRNYVVGPLTEEVVFRGCMLSIHGLAGFSKPFLIFATPLYFGFAHLHHAYEGYVKGGRTRESLKQATATSLLQFGYTCLFGWYANFLFVRTNSLLAPFVAHVFCNVMGLPNPVDAANEHPKRRWLIHVAHIAGIVGFASALMPFTKPGLFGGSWYWK